MTGESPARGSSGSETVGRAGLQSHEWKRVELLEAVREVAKRGLRSSGSPADSTLIGAVTEPKRRNRTPLTAKQIDAIQTAREGGENVMSIARRFEASRMTVWEKTNVGLGPGTRSKYGSCTDSRDNEAMPSCYILERHQ